MTSKEDADKRARVHARVDCLIRHYGSDLELYKSLIQHYKSLDEREASVARAQVS